MKKFLLILLISGGVMIYAGPNNYYVGISDIKDALYYLIKDYKSLLHKNANNKNLIEKTQKEMNEEFAKVKETIKNRKIKIDKSLKDLMQQVEELNKRAILIRTGKADKFDKYISSYVSENKDIIKKISDNNEEK